jgi:hypothetical protein
MKNKVCGDARCFLAVLLAGLAAFFAVSCTEPIPLYGRWADNRGDNISFFDDGTFFAVIVNPEDRSEKLNFEGTYTILLNSLTLSSPGNNLQIVSEWDIRGNMLYLDWVTEDGTIPLTLFKVAN